MKRSSFLAALAIAPFAIRGILEAEPIVVAPPAPGVKYFVETKRLAYITDELMKDGALDMQTFIEQSLQSR